MVEVSTDGWRGWRDITDVSLGVLRVTDRRDFYLSLRVYHSGYNKHLWEQKADVMHRLVDPVMFWLCFSFWKRIGKHKNLSEAIRRHIFCVSAWTFAAAGSIVVTGTGCTGNVLCDPFLQAFIFRQEVLQRPVESCRRGFSCFGRFFLFFSIVTNHCSCAHRSGWSWQSNWLLQDISRVSSHQGPDDPAVA